MFERLLNLHDRTEVTIHALGATGPNSLHIPDWCRTESLCAAAAGWGEPEWVPDDWWAQQKVGAGRPPPPVRAGTRRLLPGSEGHQHPAGAPSAAGPGTGHQQEPWCRETNATKRDVYGENMVRKTINWNICSNLILMILLLPAVLLILRPVKTC